MRAFRSQLLCEQVIGRGLRRTNYQVNHDGFLEAQYADVYGVPFQFIPTGRVKPVVEARPRPPTASEPSTSGRRIRSTFRELAVIDTTSPLTVSS